jgi:hypothetical protein
MLSNIFLEFYGQNRPYGVVIGQASPGPSFREGGGDISMYDIQLGDQELATARNAWRNS